MNPTLPELLAGSLAALSQPPPPESAGEFMTGRVGVIGLISYLCAQEAERGCAVRVAENRSIRTLFATAAEEGWAPALAADLEALSRGVDEDLTLSGLDASNAALRSALIRLQAALEADAGPQGLERQVRIARLLAEHAHARALKLPGEP